jgi:flagellar biosynthesis protein FlhG
MTPKYTIMDLITGRVDADRVLAEGPEQIHMLCGMSGVQELADLDWELTEHVGREIEQIALGFDFVIIDTAAGISSNVIHFLELADEIMVVVTPNTAAILDAYGIVKVAREQQVTGAIDLLLNQVQDDGEAGRVADNICRCTRRFLGYEPGIIGHLLEDPMVEQSIRNRTPLMTSFPDSMNVPLLDDLARKLTDAGRKHRRRGMRPDRLASLFMPFSLETSMHAPGTRG